MMDQMNKKQMLYQLKVLYNKLDDYKKNPKLIPEFTAGELYALNKAIGFISDEDNDKENIDKIKDDCMKKMKEEIQNRCDHVWGEEHWICSTGGWRRCSKCGKIENFYERD